MKILLVANTGWYLYNFRSALAKRLVSEGYEVAMISPHDEFVAEMNAQGFRTILWDLARQAAPPWDELGSIRKLVKIYRQEQPSLVHHFTIKPVSYGSLAARLANVPSVINSVTGRGYVFMGTSYKAAYLKLFVKLLFSIGYSHLNVATTFENASDLEFFVQDGLVPNRNLYLINGVGVDTNTFFYAPQPKTDPPLLVFPGRLLWAKGVGTLVEAARILKSRNNVRIVLVGKPDPGNPESIDERIIESWVKEGLVEWWGWQSDMTSIYHQSSLVILPSMGEGLSKALLEAAACGRPIVATDVPGCREVVIPGVTGYLVSTDNPRALAERIERLVRNPGLREQMGLSGRRLIEENYADDLVNEQIMNIYQKLLPIK
jgi:glycosyltransferase involved in cell wall biosynthesis